MANADLGLQDFKLCQMAFKTKLLKFENVW